MLAGIRRAFVQLVRAEWTGESNRARTREVLVVGAGRAHGAVLAVVAATRVELDLTAIAGEGRGTLARVGRSFLSASRAVLARMAFARVHNGLKQTFHSVTSPHSIFLNLSVFASLSAV